MNRIQTTTGVFALTTLLASGMVSAQDERRETVRFPGDSTVAEISDRISGYESVLYEVYAREGQTLEVSLRPDNRSANFNIYVPGRGFGDEALYVSETGGHEYQGDLWITGPHTIAVFLSRNAARRGETANYDLVVSLEEAGGSARAGGTRSRAESDCLDAVAGQVGRNDLRVISAEMGENSTTILVEVPGAQAPWHCEWGYRDGSPAVLQVYYGAEG